MPSTVKQVVALAVVMLSLLNPVTAHAQNDVEVVQAAADVYMIGGGGSNVTVNVGPQGLFVVDTGSAAASAKVVAAIRSISDRPIRYIANTSADLDHVGGNVEVNKLGQAIKSREVIDENATIVAYESVLKRVSAPTGQQSPLPAAAWPTATFTTPQQDYAFNNQAIQLYHLPAAHSDGDTVVFFRRSDVVATGDLFDKTRYPVIDVSKGGSITARSTPSTGCSTSSFPARRKKAEPWWFPGMGGSATRAKSWSTATC
jgi:cyclase